MFLLSYIRALLDLYRARDGGRPGTTMASVTAPLPQRDFEYHLAEIRDRLRDTQFLVREPLPDRRPFFYPCAYIDVLPFLRSGLSRGVYLDVAYLTPSRLPGAAFCLQGPVISRFFSDLFPGAVAMRAGDAMLRVRFRHEGRRKELRFVRAERSRLDSLVRLLPSGAEVLFDPDLSLDDAEGLSLARRELGALSPDLSFFRSDPWVPAPTPSTSVGIWLRREDGEELLAA